MNHFQHFFMMGGYGLYVWSAYGTVAFWLLLQWLIPWRRWRRYARRRQTHE